MVQQDNMIVLWKECFPYEEARKYPSCVYIFEWDGKPYYIGMIGPSDTFGGRYSSGYRHLIEAPLRYGSQSFRLFLGLLPDRRHMPDRLSYEITYQDIENIEYKLIDDLDPSGNVIKKYYPKNLILQHIGDVPDYLKR